jgi:hypothetical protein
MHSRLLKHLNDNSILRKHQFGFKKKNQGTENAIHSFIFGILDPLNKKCKCVGLSVTQKRLLTVLVMKYY